MSIGTNLKYIIIDIFDNIWSDSSTGYSALSKPRNLLQAIVWLIIIMILTKNLTLAEITCGIYFIVYIILIIQRGRWKFKIREKYKSKFKDPTG